MPTLNSTMRNASVAAGATNYFLCGFNGVNSNSATESNTKARMKTAGTYSKLYVVISANGVGATSTATFRKNGADGNQVVSIGSGLTGEFEDASNTDTIASGDDINGKFVAGAGGTNISTRHYTTVFTPSSGECKIYGMTNTVANSVSAASTTTYGRLNSSINIGIAAETDIKVRIRAAGVFQNARWNVTSNGRGTNTVIRGRNNGANGNIVITVAGGSTGYKEDASNTDSIASGDTYNYSITTGTGAGSFSVQHAFIDFIPTGTQNHSFHINAQAVAIVAGDTQYRNFYGGRGDAEALESPTQVKMRESDTLSYMATYLSSNTITGDGTFKIRKNAGYGNQTLTLSGSTTGYFEDASNTDTVVSGDEITAELVGGSGGTSMLCEYWGVLMELTAVGGTTYHRLGLLGVGG